MNLIMFAINVHIDFIKVITLPDKNQSAAVHLEVQSTMKRSWHYEACAEQA